MEMDRVRRMIGCDSREVRPYTGRGVYVGVLDSGVAAHPDLRGRIAAFKDFTSRDYAARSFASRRMYYDDNGHGTHVCGVLGGNGAVSRGKYRGIAPECTLICGKVLDKKGGGSLKNLISGLFWITEMAKSYPIRVLNISIEMESEENIDRDDWEQFKKQIQYLWNNNIIIVAAAGNKGPNPMTLSPIGECGGCVCVGCHDGDYQGSGGRLCNEYSSRGPGKDLTIMNMINRNPLKKPDIVAPGTDIVSCNSRYITSPYIAKSGTSMSAPIVSGACALCLQKYPYMTNRELRRLLLGSAIDLGQSWSVQGAGMLRIDKLLAQTVV
ncbi:MAG: S8 family serine peptidase [Lachnospiraceae bacterium]|nr:S8 family serine peptidase [Lachnospiraceae bacterium]